MAAADAPAQPTVREAPERSRYELVLDDEVIGVADCRRRPGAEGGAVVEIPHTHVDPRFRGRGYAATMVGAVLDDLRAKGSTVVPSCSYVAAFIADRPAYADLVARR